MDVQNNGAAAGAAEEQSLEAQLAAAMQEVDERAGGTAGAAPAATDGGAAVAAPGAAEAPAQDGQEGPARDAQGRFTATGVPVVKTPDPNAAPEPVRVPDAWASAAHKAKWDALPREVQEAIAAREADVHKEFTRQDAERLFGKQLKDVITPYMPIIQAEGGDPAKAVASLLNTAYVLRTATPEQKVALLREVAKQYSIDLAQVAAPAAFVDPALETLEQRLARLESERQADAQRAEHQAMQAVQAEIAAFAADPEHPHYEQVRPQMQALLAAGVAKDLKDAYEQACWANPTIRSSLDAERARKAEEERIKAATAAADAAKRAAGSVTGAPGATPPAGVDPNLSLEDQLRASFRAASGRV